MDLLLLHQQVFRKLVEGDLTFLEFAALPIELCVSVPFSLKAFIQEPLDVIEEFPQETFPPFQAAFGFDEFLTDPAFLDQRKPVQWRTGVAPRFHRRDILVPSVRIGGPFRGGSGRHRVPGNGGITLAVAHLCARTYFWCLIPFRRQPMRRGHLPMER